MTIEQLKKIYNTLRKINYGVFCVFGLGFGGTFTTGFHIYHIFLIISLFGFAITTSYLEIYLKSTIEALEEMQHALKSITERSSTPNVI